MDVAPNQIASIAASTPFLEHDDANRALMFKYDASGGSFVKN